MLEEESGGEPLFSATMLSQIIRFYGGTLQGMFARYLEGSLDLFSKQHHELVRTLGETPFDAMTRMTQKNVELWSEIQSELMRAAGFELGDEPPAKVDRTTSAPTDSDNKGCGGTS
jgi:polyhydroxyalkanoate synthesis regulator protein